MEATCKCPPVFSVAKNTNKVDNTRLLRHLSSHREWTRERRVEETREYAEGLLHTVNLLRRQWDSVTPGSGTRRALR